MTEDRRIVVKPKSADDVTSGLKVLRFQYQLYTISSSNVKTSIVENVCEYTPALPFFVPPLPPLLPLFCLSPFSILTPPTATRRCVSI